MLRNVRYKIALQFMKKAHNQIESGEFREIRKGLKNLKYSVLIMPPSKELSNFGRDLQRLVTKYSGETGV